MKNFSIVALSIICCTQQMHSMEKEKIKTITEKEYREIVFYKSGNFNTTERFIDVTSIRWNTKGQFTLTQTVDLLSLKLYNKNINETDIEEFVKQGADPNYHEPDLYCHKVRAITYHAFNKTEQGVKNVAKLIKLGAIRSDNNHDARTALTFAANSNNTEMIKLLLPFELFVSQDCEYTTEQHKNMEYHQFYTYTREERKDIVIDNAFKHQNLEIIKLLLDLKLLTPNKGLENFAKFPNPNQEILDLLNTYNQTETTV